jgi:hypothetical protein
MIFSSSMKLITSVLILASSILLLSCKKGQPITCGDRMDKIPNLTNAVGASLLVNCPENCVSGAVYGDGTYTVDSAVCVAAVHAGAITAAKGGKVTLTIVPSLPAYQGSEKNGISTRPWSSSWGGTAFTVK